jgi:glycosyltransferase involved in cell wall biosynthesis
MTTLPSRFEGGQLGRERADCPASRWTLSRLRRQFLSASFLYLLELSLVGMLLLVLNLITWGVVRLFPRKRGGEFKKVVHVSPTCFDESSVIGGGERYATQLAAAMAKTVESTLVTFGRRKHVSAQPGFQIRTYPYLTLLDGNPANPLSFTFLRELWEADVIHCHQYRTIMTNLCILLGTILRKRVFVTDLGGGGRNYAEALGLGEKVHGFLLLSRFCRDLLFARYVDRTTIVYGGVDTERFRPLPKCYKERKALFVGRLLPHKGINYLIEGVGENLQLDVVGRIYDPVYYQYLQELSQGKRVKFIMDASDEDILREYCSATVTVLPSVYRDVYGNYLEAPELLGLTLLESMACETPVVCTDVGGMPEIVEDGITGFVVPPNDPRSLREKIHYLLDNPKLGEQMGQAGREKVLRSFTWDSVAQKCLEAYIACSQVESCN